LDIKNAAVFGNAVAAISVTRIGTAPSMPSRDEIDKFLAEHKGQIPESL
jgi:ribokinase